jgi:hypothetical protein
MPAPKSSLLPDAAPPRPADLAGCRHVTVSGEAGRFKGWPANGGLWAWENEVVALYEDLAFSEANAAGHAIDSGQPGYHEQARSVDGGLTWAVERRPIDYPSTMAKPWSGKAATDLKEPLDFTAPDSAVLFKMTHHEQGPSFFFYTRDRARTWEGPYRFPTFGLATVNARTCYVVHGKRDLTAFFSGAKAANGREDGYETFATRTRDGGVTWSAPARANRETRPRGLDRANFTIMPSVVQLGPRELLCLARCADGSEPAHWIEVWASKDGGGSWAYRAKVYTGNGSTPPSALRLPSGRIVLTYGYRVVPYGVRARVSDDGGKTWSREHILRQDGGGWDLGYTRNVLKPNGEIVTVYYFNTDYRKERTIQATVWNPDAIGPVAVTY